LKDIFISYTLCPGSQHKQKDTQTRLSNLLPNLLTAKQEDSEHTPRRSWKDNASREIRYLDSRREPDAFLGGWRPTIDRRAMGVKGEYRGH